MAVRPWLERIKAKKKLTVFPTRRITDGMWKATFEDAIVEFNRLSRNHGLGVTLESPSGVQAPDPVGEGGAEVQFDLGSGRCEIMFEGKLFKSDTDFSPFDVHGLTRCVGIGGVRRAFIFVPEQPRIEVSVEISPGQFRRFPRLAGRGIMLYIAVHEFVHACGPDNAEHTSEGPNGDVFTINPGVAEGAFSRPDDDRFRVRTDPRTLLPPLILSKRTADLIRNNWV